MASTRWNAVAVLMVAAATVLSGCFARGSVPMANLAELEQAFEREGFGRSAGTSTEDGATVSPRSIGVVMLQGVSGEDDMMVERLPRQAERMNLIEGLPGAFVLTDEDQRPQSEALNADACARALMARAERVNAQWLLVLTSATKSETKWLLGGLDALLTLGMFPGLSQQTECKTGMLVVDVSAKRIVRSDQEREEAYQPANLWTRMAAEEQTSSRATRRVMSRLARGLEEQHDKEHPQSRWRPESLRSSWMDG